MRLWFEFALIQHEIMGQRNLPTLLHQLNDLNVEFVTLHPRKELRRKLREVRAG
jgi:hypothetical protein